MMPCSLEGEAELKAVDIPIERSASRDLLLILFYEHVLIWGVVYPARENSGYIHEYCYIEHMEPSNLGRG